MTPEEGPSDEVVTLARYCRRCHRKLKDPRSIKIGFGPICAAKEVKERVAAQDGDE